MTNNDQTLQSYDENVEAYIEGTPADITGDVKRLVDHGLDNLSKNVRVFEIGSAFGRGVKYIESKGFKVAPSDASRGFVQYMRSKGMAAQEFNLITDSFDDTYDIIYADAVLLHLNRHEAVESIKKIYKALNPSGRFVFSLKRGKGEVVSEDKIGAPRYFCLWEQGDIEHVLTDVGFKDIWVLDGNEGRTNSEWLNIVAYT